MQKLLLDAVHALRVLSINYAPPIPKVDENTLVAREIVAKHYPEHAAEIMSGKYKGRRMTIALDALDYRCPPDDVGKAARWIFDNSDGWTEDAKANAQKLAEYALRGKQ